MNSHSYKINKIKPLSGCQRIVFFISLGIVLASLSLFVGLSEGFCYDRHNGTYCYKNYSKDLLALSPAISLLALAVRALEIKTGKCLRLFEANLSAFILFLAFPVIVLAMLLSGPNINL